MNCWSHRSRSSRTSHSIDKPLFIRWWSGLFVFTIWSATELKKKYIWGRAHIWTPQYLYHGYALAFHKWFKIRSLGADLLENSRIYWFQFHADETTLFSSDCVHCWKNTKYKFSWFMKRQTGVAKWHFQHKSDKAHRFNISYTHDVHPLLFIMLF